MLVQAFAPVSFPKGAQVITQVTCLGRLGSCDGVRRELSLKPVRGRGRAARRERPSFETGKPEE